MVRKKIYNISFLGRRREEVRKELGEGLLSLYSDDIQQYELSRTWWGMKTILSLEFENNMVSLQHIECVFGKARGHK
ncbi:hypothetical protein [Epilithonimonas sp.]|uniref:hypothetical protein n=1 Tax=Epilithonimonas sp. TaxID=2894511 RepID=UPI00289DCC35|nr:hypothetical protein [Epilithonimonas sp.]